MLEPALLSVEGVTGAKSTFGEAQAKYFNRIGNMKLKTPQLVGFGISNSATYEAASKYSRGAIIGSAFINFLEKEGVHKIANFISSIR